MELLSNDLKLIVYRLLHNDAYLQVQHEFISNYVDHWSELCNCYKYHDGYKINGRNVRLPLVPKGNRYVIFDLKTGFASRMRNTLYEMGLVTTPNNY